ncbi:3-deoxy-manno-octulosonate cytidylyltransferase (CMP-KDO synthetase) [Sporomusaceae bacterium BoRhaA]|uniref:3-deoxy-manno-octulosonate cytidylyltransferase n=1 Tax=Pelorhabdus rhamnosifermentans TaxID=2772457 RepID=UPI001C062201|nr:3-deoxy-manno-octulosonate cytidylyltransferase [Pelorhabdus rhamnosifermentans]MBU2698987.1 3-deoxy-manno-octulosonate cytidylyltransferase (CMP-KDO synthetase) [Pelorhabdus rhamnosifermentans]
MNTLCIIPARYASTRFPGKPLADIAGKPMIQHVYERACRALLPTDVLVATDSDVILKTVLAFGGQAVMTSANHPTGTDRLAEVASSRPDVDVIVNVQGDEPLIDPQVIDDLAAAFLHDEQLAMATVMTPLTIEEQRDANVVKVVTDLGGYALYFSRSLIPFPRHEARLPVYKHIGLYAYRRDFLLKFASLAPTPLEQTESLEQLRVLEHGYKIKVLLVDRAPVGVDTPEDLERVNQLILGGTL